MKRLSVILIVLILFGLFIPVHASEDTNTDLYAFFDTITDNLKKQFLYCEPIKSAEGLFSGWDLGYLKVITVFDGLELKEIQLNMATKSKAFSYPDYYVDMDLILKYILSNNLNSQELTNVKKYISEWIRACSSKSNYSYGLNGDYFIPYYNEPKFRTITKNDTTVFVDLYFIDCRKGSSSQPANGDLIITVSIVFYPAIKIIGA